MIADGELLKDEEAELIVDETELDVDEAELDVDATLESPT